MNYSMKRKALLLIIAQPTGIQYHQKKHTVGYFTQNKVEQFPKFFLSNSLNFETKSEKDITNNHIITKAVILLTDIRVLNWEGNENLRNLRLMILMLSFLSCH